MLQWKKVEVKDLKNIRGGASTVEQQLLIAIATVDLIKLGVPTNTSVFIADNVLNHFSVSQLTTLDTFLGNVIQAGGHL